MSPIFTRLLSGSFADLAKMTAVNLAVVFAPTVMRPQSIEREMTDMGPQRTAIQALLENNKAIFAPEPEVLNQL